MHVRDIRPMRIKSLLVLTPVVLMLGSLSAGCQLIVDFNRGLIDSGTIEGGFDDASESFPDAGDDALGVPDAVGDVVFSDSSHPVDARAGDADANADATVDAHSDAQSDAGADAASDGTVHDAHADSAASDAHGDAASTSDAATDAHAG
jgi:hypothetical protein